jgi:hypothetical protein
LGKWEGFGKAMAEFSDRYADQNEPDYDTLADAARSGRATFAGATLSGR